MFLYGIAYNVSGTWYEFEFPRAMMEDSWSTSRPAQTMRVAGAWGGYSLLGDSGYPLVPLTVKKSFLIVEDTSAEIDDSLIAWRGRTIAWQQDELKLVWKARGENATYWQYGHCTKFSAGESVRERGRWAKKVQIEFIVPSGFWYGPSYTANPDAWKYDNTITNSTNFGAVSTGNVPMPLKFTFTPTTGDITFDVGTSLVISSSVNGTLCSLDVGGRTLANGQSIVIDAMTYSVTFAGSDDYDNLTPESLVWLYADNRTSDTITFSFSTSSSASYQANLYGERIQVF